MGKRKESANIDKIINAVDVETLQKMDAPAFMALLIVLVDARVNVLDVCPSDEIFVNEFHKDYVNDFIISVQEFAQCRQNFVKRYLYERIKGIDNGRG